MNQMNQMTRMYQIKQMNSDDKIGEINFTDTINEMYDFFSMNIIIMMEIAVNKYENKLISDNENDIEYKTTLFKMKYLEKPEIYRTLPKTILESEKQKVTAKFREMLANKSNYIKKDKIENDLYS
jgi:hypothetical protein